MNEFKKHVITKYTKKNIEILDFKLENLVFEERVKLKCFQCKNYGIKFTCPPRINSLDFKQIYNECSNALVVIVKYSDIESNEYESIRHKSTNILHKLILEIEKEFWNNNESMVNGFIGGSCKLCKECDEKKCRNPYLARIPWEATGVNIVKTLKKSYDIDIEFNNKKKLNRYGLLIW